MQGFNHKSGEYLDVEGAKIYYEIIGHETAPALLCLHGALGNIEDFNRLIPDLYKEFRIIGIDSRGHGKSTLGSKNLSYELLQREVEKILEHLNIDSLTVLGFSNGGTIAYRLAAFTSLKINKLITIGAPWCTKHVEHLMNAYSQLTSNSWKEQCPLDYEAYMKLNPEPDFDRIFKQVINMALDRSEKGRPGDQVKNISCPVLSARGENDPIVASSDSLELSKLINNAQLFNIPFAGHEALQDQPKLITEKLNRFLAE